MPYGTHCGTQACSCTVARKSLLLKQISGAIYYFSGDPNQCKKFCLPFLVRKHGNRHMLQFLLHCFELIDKWLDVFFFTNHTDSIVDTGPDDIILFGHSAGSHTNINFFMFVFTGTETYGIILMYLRHFLSLLCLLFWIADTKDL